MKYWIDCLFSDLRKDFPDLYNDIYNNWVHVSPRLVLGDGALILIKEGHQDLLKLHVHLKELFQYGGKMGLQKGNFAWSEKTACDKAYQDLLKYASFRGSLEFLMKKNGEATEEKGSIVKCGENPSEGGSWTFPGTLHVWRSYRNSWIHPVNIWWMFDWILSQNCRNTLPLFTVNQLASSANYERLLWLVMTYVKIRNYCKA